jgi:O-antigen/teichoic acid export membrane protein
MIISALLENAAKLLLGIILVYISLGVSGAVLALTVSAIVGWYITTLFIHSKKRKIREINFKPMILFTVPAVIYTLSTTSLLTSDLILVKHFFSGYEAGLYAALSTLGKIIFFATGPISSVMFPLVSKRFSQGSNYKKVFSLSFVITAVSALAILFIYYIVPDFVINLLYGSDYLKEKGLLIWFGLFVTLFTFSSLIINFNLSLGRTRVVIFPVFAAIAQLIFITYFHQSLFMVISICNVITALLLMSLLLYSNSGKKYGSKNDFGNSTSV